MKCPICGNENEKGSKFCFQCGAKLTDPSVKPLSQNSEERPKCPDTALMTVEELTEEQDLSTRPLAQSSILFKESGKEMYLPFKETVYIGRLDRNAGNIPDIDLTDLDKTKVTSRKHGCILYSLEGYKIKDLGSINGTFLNGTKLESSREYSLKNGDEIIFGKLACTFMCTIN